MYFNIILSGLFYILFLPRGESEAAQLRLFNHSPNKNNVLIENSTIYTLNYSKKQVMHLSCVIEDADLNAETSLIWQFFNIKRQKTECSDMKKRKEINYITELDASQNGNQIVCLVASIQPDMKIVNLNASIQRDMKIVNLNCIDCTDKNIENKLNVRCPKLSNNDSIAIYVNGIPTVNKVTFKNNQILTLQCETVDGDNNRLEWNHTSVKGLEFYDVSKTVINATLRMTADMNGQQLTCLMRNRQSSKIVSLKAITFVLTSNLFIEVNHQSSPSKRLYSDTELKYNASDQLHLVCKTAGKNLKLEWVKEGPIKDTPTRERTISDRKICFDVNLTKSLDNSRIICRQIMETVKHNKTVDRTLTLRFEDEVTGSEIKTISNETSSSNDINIRGLTGVVPLDSETLKWSTVGIIIVILVMIIIVLAFKKRHQDSSNTNAVSYKNFQNSYTTLAPTPAPTPTPATVDATYSAPVDSLEYAYATGTKLPGAYSTPFVPTLDEMYTQPTPKTLRNLGASNYHVPNKFKYATLQAKNQPDPGYSNLKDDNSDSVSETYSSLVYSQPE